MTVRLVYKSHPQTLRLSFSAETATYIPANTVGKSGNSGIFGICGNSGIIGNSGIMVIVILLGKSGSSGNCGNSGIIGNRLIEW